MCTAFQTGEQCAQRRGARNVCRLFRNNDCTDEQPLRGKVLEKLGGKSKGFLLNSVALSQNPGALLSRLGRRGVD